MAERCGRNSPLLVYLTCSSAIRPLVGPFHGGNMVERAGAGDGGAHVAAVEQVGAADRLPFRMKRGVRLLAVEGRRGIGGEKVGVARDGVVVPAGAGPLRVASHVEPAPV